MIDLVFWSFVVTVVPIALAVGARLLALVAGPVGPPVPPFFWPVPSCPGPHGVAGRFGRPERVDHGR